MRKASTLFIDESGKSSLAEEENQPFILTGVILDDIEIPAVEGFFNYIKRKHGIDPDKPFHSYHIFEDPRSKIDPAKAEALAKTLAEYISLIPIKITVVGINKNDFKNALGVKSNDDLKGDSKRKQMKQYPYRVMASCLFGWFGKELERKNSIGQITADSRKGGDHQLLKALHLCKEGHVPYATGYQEAVNQRVRAICFAEKGFLSGGVEITDLISYVTFFRAKRMLSKVIPTGIGDVWNEIYKKGEFKNITGQIVRRFFGIKKGEVHKYLKNRS